MTEPTAGTDRLYDAMREERERLYDSIVRLEAAMATYAGATVADITIIGPDPRADGQTPGRQRRRHAAERTAERPHTRGRYAPQKPRLVMLLKYLYEHAGEAMTAATLIQALRRAYPRQGGRPAWSSAIRAGLLNGHLAETEHGAIVPTGKQVTRYATAYKLMLEEVGVHPQGA